MEILRVRYGEVERFGSGTHCDIRVVLAGLSFDMPPWLRWIKWQLGKGDKECPYV